MKGPDLTSRTCCTLLLTTLLCLPCLATSEGDEQKKLDALKYRIELLQKGLHERARERNQLSKALRTSEVTAGKIRKQIEETEKRLNILQKELADLHQQWKTLDNSRQAQQNLIGQHVNAAYRMGREEKIKLLLNEEDPAHFNRLLKYHDYFLKARAAKINTWLKTLESLAEVKTSISARERLLLNQRNSLTARQNELKARVSERQTALANLRKSISTDKQQLARLQSERKELEAVLSTLEQAITDLALPGGGEPFSARRGKMAWPVKGRLRHRFGTRRQADITWSGWLLDAPAGSPVTSIHHGRVVFSDYLRGHGLLIIIDHSNGYMSLYAHNQVLLKEAGDWVQAGEVISKVGNSGGLGKSALYFEVRQNGKPQNPAKWLIQ